MESGTESETAGYVLGEPARERGGGGGGGGREVSERTSPAAYLLRQSYSQTVSAFLQECPQLRTKNMLVLPETPLQSLVAEHKARKDSSMLVDSLGPEGAGQALWNNLDKTLRQLKALQEKLVSTNTGNLGKGYGKRLQHKAKTNVKLPRPTTSPHFPLSPATPSTLTPPPPTSQPVTSSSASPRRKKAPPRRMAPPSQAAAGPSGSGSGMAQVMEGLLYDHPLQERLASIINTCVTRGDGVSGGEEEEVEEEGEVGRLSPGTLDAILSAACSDPAFTELLSTSATLEEQPPQNKRMRTGEELSGGGEVEGEDVRGEGGIPSEDDIDRLLDRLHN